MVLFIHLNFGKFRSLFILFTLTVNAIHCMPSTPIEQAESSGSPRLLVRDDKNHKPSTSQESIDATFQAHQARANEAMWTGSARLPSSQKLGGNENSRYNIRRDGSLSIALQGSNSPTDHNLFLSNPIFQSFVPTRTSFPNKLNREKSKLIPTELRSFSVVLSDVDVVGTYNTNNGDEALGHYNNMDSYANAGVSSYRLSSNTIHRMNALWKLNPAKTNISSEQLLNFLSLFSNEPKKQASNDESEDDDYEEENSRHQKTNRRHNENRFGPNKGNPSISHGNNSTKYQDMNSLPFSTWSETSRQLSNDNNTTITIKNFDQEFDHSDMGDVHDTSVSSRTNNNGTNPIVLHELIATLGKLIDAKNIEKNSSSLNNNNGSISQNDYPNKKATRMGTSDPQQTATDLKRLMSLLLKSGEGAMTQTKNGAQIVNIVITPNNNSQSHDSKQKIVFLKNPQIKRLLEIALQTPSLKTAAHKVAAGLYNNPEQNSSEDFFSSPISYSSAACSNCSPQEDIEFLQPMSPLINLNPQLTTSSTPDGFPITGNGILNLNHPNLQFHQALHHLVANGTTPTVINATTKTNVINIFVINLNPSVPPAAHLEKIIKNNNTFEGTEADDVDNYEEEPEKQSIAPLRVPVVYSLKNQKPNYQQHGNIILKRKDEIVEVTPKPANIAPTYSNFQQTFLNKVGLPSDHHTQETVSSQKYKPLIDVTSSHGNPYIAIKPIPSTTKKPTLFESSTEKINIFDLLPGKINSYTKVEPNNPAESSPDKLRLEKETAELFSYLFNSENESSLIQTTTEKPFSPHDSLPPEFSHLSWILKQEPPPKPVTPPRRPNYGLNKNQFIKKIKPKQPYYNENDEDEYNDSYSIEKEGEYSQSTQQHSLNKFTNSSSITQESIGNKTSLYDQFLDTGVLNFTTSRPKRKPESTTVRIISTTKRLNNNRGIKNQGNKQSTVVHRRPTFLSSFTGNNQNDTTKQNVRGRVKKLVNALKFSLPSTIAAGAAATWPYWVPILATGRKGRDFSYSSHSNSSMRENSTSNNGTESQLTMRLKPIELKVGDELERNLKSGTTVELKKKPVGMDRRQVEPGGGLLTENDKKWIKVEVITESSSPTLVDMKIHHHSQNKSTIQRSPLPKIMSNNNNRQFVNGEPQDVPLLKNFLKSVLSNEWNISTTTPPSYSYSSSPTHFSFNSTNSVVRPKPSWSVTPYPNLDSKSPSLKTNNTTKTESIYVGLSKSQLNNADSNKSLIAPIKFDRPIPSSTFGQSVNHISKIPGGHTTNNKIQTPINEQQLVIRENNKAKKKNLAAIIHKAESTYASAALLPIWFPILMGNGISSLHKQHYSSFNDPNTFS